MGGSPPAPPAGEPPGTPGSGRPAPGRAPAAAIRARIAAQGPITFATFMDLALYQPRHGYYSALRAPPGPRGDFFTSPETHPAFGALLARQALEVWERLGRPQPFVVEEWGAGSGRLAADLLTAAPGSPRPSPQSLGYRDRRAQRRAAPRPAAPAAAWLAQLAWPGPIASEREGT